MQYIVGVMHEIVKDYTGAEKPLEYTFVNQQVSGGYFFVFSMSNLHSFVIESIYIPVQIYNLKLRGIFVWFLSLILFLKTLFFI